MKISLEDGQQAEVFFRYDIETLLLFSEKSNGASHHRSRGFDAPTISVDLRIGEASWTGTARAGPKDKFDLSIGCKLALRQAMKTLPRPLRTSIWKGLIDKGVAIKTNRRKLWSN